jgi:hypothetical protein
VLISAADAVLAPVTTIDGFLLACLMDPSTGTNPASASGEEEVSFQVAAPQCRTGA